MKEIKVPPKITKPFSFLGGPSKKAFMRPGTDRYCPYCKRVFEGPDKDKIIELPPLSEHKHGPIVINRHKTSIETCPDCLAHGVKPLGMHEDARGSTQKAGEAVRRPPESGAG